MSFEYTDMSTLTVRELLSMTLRESPYSQVIEELTSRFTSLRDLTDLTFTELAGIKGIGPSKASSLLASLELAKRIYTATPEEYPVIRSPEDVIALVMHEMRYLDREHFRALLLNTKNCILRTEIISIGTLNSSQVHPRELFKGAVKHSAAGIILVHNHPSGDPTPSKEDMEITNRLVEAGNLLGISILDHIIIGDGKFVSFKGKGLI
ncbi:RadC family protein [Pelotomaculum propionicicum]|uniref:MPN domain-containing protein n=1 Tax=Pelotomaculum propionicicum TaxID=258475 RepID=A0A4Y7RK33_9FIRM|nr:DNA repair protein RadC [Pelotomaculum propionicicum]TEB09186.1 hypothetical protein Pmgp_03318 [Pelotomaculum propionicicum]